MALREPFYWKGKYTFVDVEIPNIQNNSVCAISMIVVENRKIVLEHTELIDPQDVFSPVNISIHNIHPKDVKGKRSFKEFWQQYHQYFSSEYTIVGHNVLSDLSVMRRDLERFGFTLNTGFYIDTMDLGLQEFYKGQHKKGDLKLNNLCSNMGIALKHHDPKSDVRACFEILKYLHDKQGFEDLQSYVKETILKPERAEILKNSISLITKKQAALQMNSRNFKPYFGIFKKKEYSYHPYFDKVTLADLKNTAFGTLNLEPYELASREKEEILAFLKEIDANVFEGKELYKSSSMIEFGIPSPEQFLKYKKMGMKFFHSLDVIAYIRRFKASMDLTHEDLEQIMQDTKALLSLSKTDKSTSTEFLTQKGLEAFEKKDFPSMIYFYESAAARKSGNIRIYRQLADLYERLGFLEEENRILSAGIRICRRKKKNPSALIRKQEKVLKALDEKKQPEDIPVLPA